MFRPPLLLLISAWCLFQFNNPAVQAAATLPSSETNVSPRSAYLYGPSWKCPPNHTGRYCTLPSQFPWNVVSTGGLSGCTPGGRMRPGSQCTVTCKAGAVPVPNGGSSVGTFRCEALVVVTVTAEYVLAEMRESSWCSQHGTLWEAARDSTPLTLFILLLK